MTYEAAHQRVKRERGRASLFPCNWCGITAEDWAYDHGDENQREANGRVWSDDPTHYDPLCKKCHATFDRAYALGVDISPLRAAAESKLTDAQKRYHADSCANQRRMELRARQAATEPHHAEKQVEDDRKLAQAIRRSVIGDQTLVGFFPLVVICGPDSEHMTGAELHASYVAWCKEAGYRALGRTVFYSLLEEIGFQRSRRSAGVVFHGIRRTESV